MDWPGDILYALTSDGVVWSNAGADGAVMTEAGFNPGVEWVIETDSGVCGLIPTGGDTEIECLQWPAPVETATLDSPVKSVGLLGLIVEDGRLVVPVSSDPAEFFEMRVAGKIIQSGLSVMYNLCVLIDEGTLFCTSYPVYEDGSVPTYPSLFPGRCLNWVPAPHC